MPDLPGGIWTLTAVCGAALLLVGYFAIKEALFSHWMRSGLKLLRENRPAEAVSYLVKAEKIWMLRLSKQTMSSRAEDCGRLVQVIDAICDASKCMQLRTSAQEYRDAAFQMQQFFRGLQVNRKQYPRLFQNFKQRRRTFQQRISELD